jgi:hypothetical protein
MLKRAEGGLEASSVLATLERLLARAGALDPGARSAAASGAVTTEIGEGLQHPEALPCLVKVFNLAPAILRCYENRRLQMNTTEYSHV